MPDIVVGIKLTADGKQVVATLNGVEQKMKATGDSATVAGLAIEASTNLLTRFISIGAGLALAHKFIEISDAATTMSARLDAAVGTMGNVVQVQADLLRISNSLQFSYHDLASGAAPVIEAIRDMGGSSRTATQLIAALAAAAKAGGQSGQEAAAQMQQFASVLTLGVQDGRNLVSILRDNDNVARALAASLGITTQELKGLAQAGQLTAEKLVSGLIAQLGNLQKSATDLPPTVSGALAQIGNVSEQIAANDRTLAEGMTSLAKYIIDINAAENRAAASALTAGQNFNVMFTLITSGADAARRKFDEFIQSEEKAARASGRLAVGKIGGLSTGEKAPAFGGTEELNKALFASAEGAFKGLLRGSNTASRFIEDAKTQSALVTGFWDTMAAADAAGAAKYKAQENEMLASISANLKQQLEALAKRGQPNLASIFGNWETVAAAEQAGFANVERIEQDSLSRQMQALDFQHQAGLVSERQYIDERAALQEQAAQAEVTRIQAQLASTRALYAKEAAVPAVGADQQEQKAQRLAALTVRQASLEADLTIAEKKVGDAGVQASQAVELARQKLIAQLLQINRATEDYARGLHDGVDDQRLQLSLVGQTVTVQGQLTAQAQLERQEREKILEIDRQIEDERAKGAGADAAVIATLQAERAKVVSDTNEAIAATRGLVAATQDAADRTQALQSAWHAVDDTAWQFVQNLQGGWRNAMESMTATLKSTLLRLLYEMTVQKWVVQIFAQVTGAGGSPGIFAGSSPTSAALSSVLGLGGNSNALTGLGSGLLNTGLAAGAYLTLGGASASQAAILAAQTADFGLAGTASTLSALGAGGAGALLSTVGAAIPYVGIALAAASALGLFDKSPSPTKGQFGVSAGTKGFEDNAFTATKFGNIGFLDAGTQQFNGPGAQVFNQQIAGALNAIAERLSPEQIARVASELQSTKFKGEEGTYSTKDFIAKYGGNILKEVIASAFGELNPALATLMSHFKGSADAVTAYANALLSINDAVSSDPLKDAQEAFEKQAQSVYDVLQKQAQQVSDLASKYDGTADATAALAAATTAYQQDLIALLLQIKQVSTAVHGMFADTEDAIARAGLTNQQLYQRDQQHADDLYSQVFLTNDPAKVQELASKINSLINDAFSQLSPEQQLADKGEFLSHIQTVDESIAKYLQELGASASSGATSGPFADVQAALASAAGKMTDAATTQQTAAASMAAAAAAMNGAAASMGSALSDIHVTIDAETAAVGG